MLSVGTLAAAAAREEEQESAVRGEKRRVYPTPKLSNANIFGIQLVI